MLDVEQARGIAERWRSKFGDEETFKESWSRYFATAQVPDGYRLETWLQGDLNKAAAAAVVSTKEPLLPVRQDFDLTDCYHCSGRGWYRKDLPVGHAEFGRAHRCPSCNS